MVTGSLYFQPGGANYTSAVLSSGSSAQAFGVVVASNGTLYQVVNPNGAWRSGPIAIAGTFNLTRDQTAAGGFDLGSVAPAVVVSSPSNGSEVNLTLDAVAVPAGGVTVGFGVGTGTAYVAFGDYPAFFSNVTLQGVSLSPASFSSVFDVSLPWFTQSAQSFGLPSDFSLQSVVVVNQSIWLSSSARIQGQAQLVISPANVSQFISRAGTGSSQLSATMLPSVLHHLEEEKVAAPV
jgi:hypothetical protein